MQLKVGKTYKTRDGFIVEIESNLNSTYPFKGMVNGLYQYYTPEGNFWVDKDYHSFDLVEEHHIPMQLEVGKEYISRRGHNVKITDFFPDNTFPYSGDDYKNYSADGTYYYDNPCELDLIEEVIPEEIPLPELPNDTMEDLIARMEKLTGHKVTGINFLHTPQS